MSSGPSVEQHLFWCWQNGLGIGQTLIAVRRTCKVRLEFEDVHKVFVDLSWRFR